MNRKPENCANYETRFKGGTCISCENYKPGPHRLDETFKTLVGVLKFECEGEECDSGCPFKAADHGCGSRIKAHLKETDGWKRFGT